MIFDMKHNLSNLIIFTQKWWIARKMFVIPSKLGKPLISFVAGFPCSQGREENSMGEDEKMGGGGLTRHRYETAVILRIEKLPL